jgi:hypothetical protein
MVACYLQPHGRVSAIGRIVDMISYKWNNRKGTSLLCSLLFFGLVLLLLELQSSPQRLFIIFVLLELPVNFCSRSLVLLYSTRYQLPATACVPVLVEDFCSLLRTRQPLGTDFFGPKFLIWLHTDPLK